MAAANHHFSNQQQDDTVIVTGAAGGIGSALAAAYASAGHRVVLSDRNAEAGQRVMDRIIEKGASEERMMFHAADLRRPEQIGRLFQTAAERFGSVDVLINNAGFGHTVSLYELSIEQWDDVIDTNLRGTFLCSRAAATLMRGQRTGGRIVNIASTRAAMSEVNTEAYAASKGGIVSLTHAMAVSLGPDGIRVNCISPGWIETGDYDALREADHIQHPAGRVGRTDDIVRACFYLTDRENSFVTGINLTVDGGMTVKMIYEP
ncbi:SDR family NAD(P)-dependent oxidoreductase [Paenibacillus kobensis]|uniref:SDR family NAD(P)-dependent oxidoreductase n=1 Tax=Paenibacillus kobensis TaxID=59841 RepID=UPI000FD919D4|nr:glucose 1-dehydrogenase [Paenibacillus kobensis]